MSEAKVWACILYITCLIFQSSEKMMSVELSSGGTPKFHLKEIKNFLKTIFAYSISPEPLLAQNN